MLNMIFNFAQDLERRTFTPLLDYRHYLHQNLSLGMQGVERGAM